MPTPTAPHGDGKIADLQALRGLSILMVLVQHWGLTHAVAAALPRTVSVPFWLGVDLFFIISGYVIMRSLMRDRFEPLSFFVKRLFRLMPCLLLFLLFTATLNAFLSRQSLSEQAQALFVQPWRDFLHQALSIVGGFVTLAGVKMSYVNGAMWSLSVEDQFYAFLCLLCLVVFLAARRHAPRLLAPALLVLALFLYTSCLGIRLWLASSGMPWRQLPQPWRYLIEWRFDFLPLGILLAYLDRACGPALVRFFRDRGRAWAPVLFLVPLWLATVAEDPLAMGNFIHGIAFPITGLCFALLVLIAAHDLALAGRASWWNDVLVYLGDRSYTLYVFHFAAYAVAWGALIKLAPWCFADARVFGVLHILASLLVLVPLTEAIYRLVEQPMIRLGRRAAARLRLLPAPVPADMPARARQAA